MPAPVGGGHCGDDARACQSGWCMAQCSPSDGCYDPVSRWACPDARRSATWAGGGWFFAAEAGAGYAPEKRLARGRPAVNKSLADRPPLSGQSSSALAHCRWRREAVDASARNVSSNHYPEGTARNACTRGHCESGHFWVISRPLGAIIWGARPFSSLASVSFLRPPVHEHPRHPKQLKNQDMGHECSAVRPTTTVYLMPCSLHTAL